MSHAAHAGSSAVSNPRMLRVLVIATPAAINSSISNLIQKAVQQRKALTELQLLSEDVSLHGQLHAQLVYHRVQQRLSESEVQAIISNQARITCRRQLAAEFRYCSLS